MHDAPPIYGSGRNEENRSAACVRRGGESLGHLGIFSVRWRSGLITRPSRVLTAQSRRLTREESRLARRAAALSKSTDALRWRGRRHTSRVASLATPCVRAPIESQPAAIGLRRTSMAGGAPYWSVSRPVGLLGDGTANASFTPVRVAPFQP